MSFWDSSAIVPLLVEQTMSKACRSLRRTDPAVAVWALSRVEISSAIRRLVRDAELGRTEADEVLRRADRMFARFTEVVAVEAVCERSHRVLAIHPLTAADAMQLSAALVLVSDRPRRRGFVTADERLAEAAAKEGFDAVVPRES